MKTFISHSSKDKEFVIQLASRLSKEQVWFDMWDMDLGDVLSEKIEKGIDETKIFVIILSENSINSAWVKYELNMAIIKFLEDEDYRLIIVRIDDTSIPLRLKPFLRIEMDHQETYDNIIENVYQAIKTTDKDVKSFRRQFVNRHEEIEKIQDYLYEDDVRFLGIIGLFGIGKSSLIREALKRIYSNIQVAEFILSPAHFGARLTIELCSRAGLPLPKDGAPQPELFDLNIAALEQLISKKTFIIFNRVESLLDEDGFPHEDILEIIKYFSNNEISVYTPLCFLSTRWFKLPPANKTAFQFLQLKGLSNIHLVHIIQTEIERITSKQKYDRDALLTMASPLQGYPLAGKLAAPLIVQYGLEYLQQNVHLIHDLKVDIAEEIISKINVEEEELQVLEIIAIFDNPLNLLRIKNILHFEDDHMISIIDKLSSKNLIESQGDGLVLHPLVNDYYLKSARKNSKFNYYAENLADMAKSNLAQIDSTHPKYVFWLINACRLLFYCGKLHEGRALRQDLIGEVKNAAIKLYHRQEYSTALEFCNDYLETKPDDIDILYTKSRCLSRLGELDPSLDMLQSLIKYNTNSRLTAKYYYAIGRAYLENSQRNETEFLELAESSFLNSIHIREHESALQSMAELLFRQEKYDDAKSYIEKKLKLAPMDTFALSLYADILWEIGEKANAIDNLILALKTQPKNPNILYRAGRFFYETNRPKDAEIYFKKVLMYDASHIDAKLSLASVYIDLGFFQEASDNLKGMQNNIKGDKRYIYDSICANLLIETHRTNEAEEIAIKLLRINRNVANIGLLAKVYIAKYKESKREGLSKLSERHKNKAIELLNEGLALEPKNERLLTMLASLQ